MEAQMRVVLHAFAHPHTLDGRQKAVGIIAQYEDLQLDKVFVQKAQGPNNIPELLLPSPNEVILRASEREDHECCLFEDIHAQGDLRHASLSTFVDRITAPGPPPDLGCRAHAQLDLALSSRLSDKDIECMVSDAEQYTETDKVCI
ncbi:hypothetical protein POSPLADRAFT_1063099 [Postia placenta MAD-698-R-SB12]|uniref:Uncharacterized protein n=1 Tax=Postia placenta MAD-698-R-SB12 TaxID=670580 RepID=A0A1X6MID6_9APHY|nr:hypothetical protein POSPLADRAFT_1063099 [Postia placenta MAD-698-R-SB12]OSX56006.1 hypothetical protein POSPLADRAFT_1063099 [Postia placenta MAD-698-R-SB12]